MAFIARITSLWFHIFVNICLLCFANGIIIKFPKLKSSESKQWCGPIVISSSLVKSLMTLFFVYRRELAYISGWRFIFETLAEFKRIMHLYGILTCVTAAIDVDVVNSVRRNNWLCGQYMVRFVRGKGRQLAEVSGWFSRNVVSRQFQGYVIWRQQQ